jgi:pimeloyl-ACP methyl ester carboxylesterase
LRELLRVIRNAFLPPVHPACNFEELKAMAKTHQQVRLSDGRRLGYAEYGDPLGRPLLYFHGYPSSRLEAAYSEGAALRRGVRIIAVDRPGYGLSDYQPRRRLIDWPDDVRQLADQLGVGRFTVQGVSGGGPYALACGWKLGDRVAAVKVVGGLGPLTVPTALRAMRWNARIAFGLARRSELLFVWGFGAPVGQAMRLCPAVALGWQWLTGSAGDRKVLALGDIRAILSASIRESLRQGIGGAAQEAALYTRDWGFPLAAISVPVELWHGDEDRIVPQHHLSALAVAMPHASVNLLRGEGHYSLPITHCENIIAA